MKWFVIHPDGQRYGPADADELREWLEEKRAKRDTEVEDARTGARSTVEAVLGLAPEVVLPDLTLDTVSDDATLSFSHEIAAQPPNLRWPDERPVEAKPEPKQGKVDFAWPKEPPVKLEAEVKDDVVYPPVTAKAPQKKMSKAPRASHPVPTKSKADQLVGQSIAVTTIGFLFVCCAIGPIIGLLMAKEAEKQGGKGARGAKTYGIVMTVVTIGYWLIFGPKMN